MEEKTIDISNLEKGSRVRVKAYINKPDSNELENPCLFINKNTMSSKKMFFYSLGLRDIEVMDITLEVTKIKQVANVHEHRVISNTYWLKRVTALKSEAPDSRVFADVMVVDGKELSKMVEEIL